MPTWTNRSTGITSGVVGHSIAINPNTARLNSLFHELILAASDGCYHSIDGGRSWEKFTIPDPSNAEFGDSPAATVDELVFDWIAYDPTDPTIIYTRATKASVSRIWIYKSSDSGASWSSRGISATGGSGETTLITIDHNNGGLVSGYYTDGIDDPDNRASLTVASGLNGTAFGLEIDCGSAGSTVQPIGDGSGSGLQELGGLSPPATNAIKLTVWVDPNSLTGTNLTVYQVGVSSTDPTWAGLFVASVNIFLTAGNAYRVVGSYWDGISTNNTGQWAITDGPHKVEIIVERESGASGADGVVTLYIDDDEKVSDTTVENFEIFNELDEILVVAAGTANDTDGSVYADEISVTDNASAPAADEYTAATVRRQCDVDQDGSYIYIAAINSLSEPVLIKIATTLSADGTIVYQPGQGDDIGVQCGKFDSDVIWLGGDFGGTDVVALSTDEAATFTVVDPGTFSPVRSFAVGPDNDGRMLIFTENDDIKETLDSGSNWTEKGSSLAFTSRAIARLSKNVEELVSGNAADCDYAIATGADDGFASPIYNNSSSTISFAPGPSTKCWFRFQSVAVPNAATITNAYIVFTASSSISGSLTQTIDGEDADNPTAPTDAADYSGRTRTTASVGWSITTAWASGEEVQTADITTIIQEIVNRGGWASGNALNIFVEHSSGSGSRDIRAYDGEPTKAAMLVIVYDNNRVVYSVNSGGDFEDYSNGISCANMNDVLVG